MMMMITAVVIEFGDVPLDCTVFHKIGTPLFSFCNFSKRSSIFYINYITTNITVFATNFFYPPAIQCFTYWTTRSGARYKTKIRDVHELRERNVDEWISALSTKSLESDEKLIKKQTYAKTETCKLYSRVCWIFLPILSSKSILIILSYTVSKFARFLRHSV